MGVIASVDSIGPGELFRLAHQFDFNQHIPTILLIKISSLNNINYKDILLEFKKEYENKKFKDLFEEYDIISKYLNKLFIRYFPDKFNRILINSLKGAKAYTVSASEVRERFIHPFQSFLIGSIIIDSFYKEFEEYYSSNLCCRLNSSIEASWLLASILHDRDKPLKELRDMLEYEYEETMYVIPDQEKNLKQLVSLYNHLKDGGLLHEWKSEDMDDQNPLFIIFNDLLINENHGVTSALQLMYHINEEITDTERNPGYVEAALAICLHDSDPYDNLLNKGYFPLNLKSFPIPCLLLFCDEIQEWSRYTELDIETRFGNITIEVMK